MIQNKVIEDLWGQVKQYMTERMSQKREIKDVIAEFNFKNLFLQKNMKMIKLVFYEYFFSHQTNIFVYYIIFFKPLFNIL